MTDKVKLIKQEIERRYYEYKALEDKGNLQGKHAMYEDLCILQFIDSLPEEPKCIYNRTLDERKKFCKYCSAACDVRIEEEPASEDLEEYAKKLTKGAALDKHNLIWMCKKGAEWQKQQMMKDAVERTWGTEATSSFMSDFPNIECGDKVKIIIVKEE